VAVRFGGTAGYSATTGIPAGPASTFLFWLYPETTAPAFQSLIYLRNAAGANRWFETAGATIDTFSDVSGATTTAGAIAANTWYRVAITDNGTTTTIYLATQAGVFGTYTGNSPPPATPTLMRLAEAGATGGVERLTGRMAALKSWSATLTATEVAAEFAQFAPVRTTGLVRYHRFTNAATGATAQGGGASTLTVVGTITDAADPVGIPESAAVARTATSVTDTVTTVGYTMLQGELRTASSETGTSTVGEVTAVGHTAAAPSVTGTTTTGAVTSVAHTAEAMSPTDTTTSSSVTVAHFAEATSSTDTVTSVTFVRDTISLPSTGPLFFDFWVVDRATNTLVAPLPDYRDASIAPVLGEPGAVRITYPVDGLNYALLRDGVTHERDLELEVWVGGRKDAGQRVILMESNGDRVAEQGIHTFGGHFLPILLDEMVVLPDPTDEKQETRFVAATAGAIVKTLVQRAQTAGYLTGISTSSFSTTVDSNGVAWGQQANIKFSPGRKYLEVMADLAEYGLCEFEITPDRQLRLYKYGTRGVDRTIGASPMILRRGEHLTQSPRSTSVREAGTDLLAAGKEGLYRTESNATAAALRGRRILRYASANGLDDPEALIGWAQAQLVGASAGQDERAHELSFGPGNPLPIADYDLGDWIGTSTGDPTIGFERERVMQWSFEENEHGEVSGNVVTGTPFMDAVDRLRRRVAAIEGGSTVVGTSEPGAQEEDLTPPAAPTGVLASSIAYQDPEHTQTLAVVTVGWQPVTTNAEGSHDPKVQAAQLILDRMESVDPILEDWTWVDCPQVVRDYNDPLLALFEAEDPEPQPESWLQDYIDENTGTPTVTDDVAGYRVRYAYLGLAQVGGIPSSDPFPEDERVYYEATAPGGTTQTSHSFGGVEGGSNLRIEVCAFDRSGNQGAWTAIGHDVVNDALPPPTPSTPTVSTWFRTMDITWDGLGSAGEAMPPDFDHVEVHVSLANNFTPIAEGEPGSTFVTRLYGPGTWNVTGLPHGVGHFARFVSVDRVGNRQPTPSPTSAAATAEQLFPDDLRDSIINDPNMIAAQTIGTLHVVDGAIIRAKIGSAAIGSAQIEELEVGKLTSGTMNATVVVAGSFRTSLNSAANRLEIDANGIRLYQGSTQIGRWQVSDASMLVTGTYQSALSGARINIFPDGTLRFYPTSGTNYSQMSNVGTDVVWRGPLDGSNRSGRINANALGVGINFSAEANLLESIRAEFVVLDRRTRMQAPFMAFVVDEGWTNPAGGVLRAQFSTAQSNGATRPNSYVSYYCSDEGNRAGGFFGQGAGIKFEGGQVLVTGDELSNFGTIKAAVFAEGSSTSVKTDIEDARAALDPAETIRAARAVTYRYTNATTDDPKIGVLAEELPDVLVRNIDNSPSIDLGSQIGVLWGFANQVLDQQIVSTSGNVVLLRSTLGPGGILPSAATAEANVVWDSVPPAAPTGGFVQLHSSFVWAGKVTAWIKTGTVSATGCTVVFKNISNGQVVVNENNDNLRVSATVIGLGLFTPPYEPPEE
jgi:hypothetical protein